MKYYIATAISRAPFHNLVRDGLKQWGYEITYDWTLHGSVRLTSKSRLQEVAHLESQGILDADFVLVLLPGGRGTHVELGLSIASQKRVFIHSEDPRAFEVGPEACAFHHHACVVQFSCPIALAADSLQNLLLSSANSIFR